MYTVKIMDAPLLRRTRCEMWTLQARATTPLAALLIFDWGVRLEGRNRLVRALITTWEARYEDPAPVRPVVFGRRGRGQCVRFTAKGTAVATCGTHQIERVLDAVDSAGGQTARAPVRVRRFEPTVEYT